MNKNIKMNNRFYSFMIYICSGIQVNTWIPFMGTCKSQAYLEQ
jgi:hypothetical protein